jgi:hypothetical protein
MLSWSLNTSTNWHINGLWLFVINYTRTTNRTEQNKTNPIHSIPYPKIFTIYCKYFVTRVFRLIFGTDSHWKNKCNWTSSGYGVLHIFFLHIMNQWTSRLMLVISSHWIRIVYNTNQPYKEHLVSLAYVFLVWNER